MIDKLALVVVDVQQAFDDPSWGRRDNPECERNTAALVDAWRGAQRPVVFVRHDSTEPASTLRPGRPGNAFKDVVAGEPDLLVTKQVNSSFHGTPDLDAWLRAQGLDAEELARVTAANLHGEFATVGRTADLLGDDPSGELLTARPRRQRRRGRA